MNKDGQQRDVGERRVVVWFALLGGGMAWTLHLVLAYGIAEFGCLSGLGEERLGALTMVAWLLLGLSAAALALAAAATAVAAKLRRERRGGSESEDGRAVAFSGELAWMTNVVFTFVIAVQSVPILYYLGRCG